MNYYNPNFYQNYPYQSNSQYVPQQTQYSQIGLNGKIVDSADMVRATEVPIGGYGIFPKADLSEIYIKNWNPNGTTSIITFKPFVEPEPEPQQAAAAQDMNVILEKINALEDKIDAVLSKSNSPVVSENKKGMTF